MKDIQPTSLIDKVNNQINKNKTVVIGFLVLVLAGFGGYSIYSTYNHKYEEKAQSAFFEAERLHAANQVAAQPTKNQNSKDVPPANVDTTQVEEKLTSLIIEFPKSRASVQASILFADILLQKKDSAKAIGVLEKEFSSYSGHLLDSMLALKLSGVYEQNSQCDKALPVLEKIYKSKVSELKPEVLLRTALCEETLGQTDKAKQSYQKLATEFSDTSQGQQAQKFLKIL